MVDVLEFVVDITLKSGSKLNSNGSDLVDPDVHQIHKTMACVRWGKKRNGQTNNGILGVGRSCHNASSIRTRRSLLVERDLTTFISNSVGNVNVLR